MRDYYKESFFTSERFDNMIKDRCQAEGGIPPDELHLALVTALDAETLADQMIDAAMNSLYRQMSAASETIATLGYDGQKPEDFYQQLRHTLMGKCQPDKKDDKLFTSHRVDTHIHYASTHHRHLVSWPAPSLCDIPIQRLDALDREIIFAPKGWFTYSTHSHFRWKDHPFAFETHPDETPFCAASRPMFRINPGKLKRIAILGIDNGF